MTIKELQDKIDAWIKKFGVRYLSELTNMALLTEEVGELSRHIARTYGEQSYKKKTNSKELIKEEIADIFFVLVCMSNQINIDLTKCILESIEKKTSRDSERHKKNKKLFNE